MNPYIALADHINHVYALRYAPHSEDSAFVRVFAHMLSPEEAGAALRLDEDLKTAEALSAPNEDAAALDALLHDLAQKGIVYQQLEEGSSGTVRRYRLLPFIPGIFEALIKVSGDPDIAGYLHQYAHEMDELYPKRGVRRISVNQRVEVVTHRASREELSCAYYLAVMGHHVTVFEKEKKLGGMLTLGIPSFRLEKDIIDAEIDVLRQLGVKFVTGAEVGKYVTIPELRMEGFEGFYIAIGAQGGRKLGVEGEDACGVISGVEFMRRVNNDEMDALTGRTVVIGGGNVAVDVARSAVRICDDKVSLYCLEQRKEMPASADEVEDMEREGITVNNGWGPKRILVKDGRVCGVEFKRCTSVFNAEGRFSPVYDENDTMTVECDNVLAAIGQSIEWGSLLEGTKVELNRNGTAKTVPITEVKTNLTSAEVGIEPTTYHLDSPFEVYQTAEPDIFVGGDVYSGPKFAIDAIAAGKEAAESLHRFVWKGHSLVLGRNRKKLRAIDKDNADLSTYDTAPRQRPILNAANALSSHDPRLTLTPEQVKLETARCLGCGAAHVDQTLCWGCGMCTTRCKFDAISLEKKHDEWGLTYEQLLAALS